MPSDLSWIAPAATLIGVALGAKLNGNRAERREDRKAILASRANLVAELDLEPMTTRIRMEEGRRDRVELMLLGIGLSSGAVVVLTAGTGNARRGQGLAGCRHRTADRYPRSCAARERSP